jgi:hypothetical protein
VVSGVSPTVKDDFVQHDDANDDDGAFFREHTDRCRRRQRDEPCEPPGSGRRPRVQIRQEPAEDTKGREQVRAADDVGHGFGRQRVDGPQCGDWGRRGRVGPAKAASGFSRTVIGGFSRTGRTDEPCHHHIHQQNVDDVQEQVDGVVPGGPVLVAEDRVVEQIRQRRQRPIETAFADRPPVRVLNDQIEVRARRGVDARVLEDQRFVIEREAGAERVCVGEDGEGDEDANSPTHQFTNSPRSLGGHPQRDLRQPSTRMSLTVKHVIAD